ncbi:hypothetical protein K505DRAFT_327339 [Melanomma pulvis-pyrius CBS 109.77]|uniref:Prokaryotic-type class I peptide chain release factors domain-containing protein n=1 Tax=Melanomma pulvis-pyrius CBS 109.77 TaxID=1314802 RepID=A0A6A6X337_9PLEO|nr:hypothetical protein K505DRAFT_327339 [Melanomma pulvis-pyrius CBS 109.77]
MQRLVPLLRLPSLRRSAPILGLRQSNIHPCPRLFTASCRPAAKNLPPRRVIHDSEIEENFLKGSGPGGQKINKTSSAVQLKHLATGIVVKYQDTRSRSLNRKNARMILGEKLEELEKGEESRVRVKAREKSRKKASSTKKKRRKYRGLEGAKDEVADEEGLEGVEESAGTSESEAKDLAKDGTAGKAGGAG